MWELDPRFHTPGWAERRLKELAEEKQRIVPAGEGMKFIPARFSDEQIDQIRAVMREEIRLALSAKEEPPKIGTWDGLEVLIGDSKKFQELREQTDTSTVASSSVVVKEYHNCAPEIDGPSVTAELEHQGKLYKGILYFVRDLD